MVRLGAILSEEVPKLLRLRCDGRFFRAGEERVFVKAVTYGPFPDWWSEDAVEQCRQIRDTGFNAIRVYEWPTPYLLDAAEAAGLWVWVTIPWGWGQDFIAEPSLQSAARVRLTEFLREQGGHSALAGILVANEIPADMVRWMGPQRVLEAVESLIDLCREEQPDLLYAYANYPTTEYLEPANADFTAFNVFLETPDEFASYLRRLQTISGDRPVLITELGLDTQRASEEAQAALLENQIKICASEGLAGVTYYSWCDAWKNAGEEVFDWSFGLKSREGRAKPALVKAQSFLPKMTEVRPSIEGTDLPMVSVVVCTYNGATRMAACLDSLRKTSYKHVEVIVVNDGSLDGTSEVVRAYSEVRLIEQENLGLSVARNRGAEEAKGEIVAYTDDDCEVDEDWVAWVVTAFSDPEVGVAGGPNLPPPAESWQEAAVTAAVGGPSHVLYDDERAEHLPGCNFVVRKEAWEKIGGFDGQFRAAGDDVDFCWRLMEEGWTMKFVPTAFVWHRRRLSLWQYIKQQRGYGRAERLLYGKHPERFNQSGAIEWSGVIYTGGVARVDDGAVIYHGGMGAAPYQSVWAQVMPLRPVEKRFDRFGVHWVLSLAERVAQAWRAWERCGKRQLKQSFQRQPKEQQWHRYEDDLQELADDLETVEWAQWSESGATRWDVLSTLVEAGWKVSADTENWDLENEGVSVLVATEQSEGKGALTRIRVRCLSGESRLVDDLRHLIVSVCR